MDGLPTNLSDDPKELIALLQKQQRQLERSEKRNERLEKKLHAKNGTIEKLEERLRALLIHRFGRRSEKFNPNQFTLFNEAEHTVDTQVLPDDTDEINVKLEFPRFSGHRGYAASAAV